MIRRIIGFVVALALTVVGGAASLYLLFVADRFRAIALAGSGVMFFIGVYWLWVDYLNPAPKPNE